MKNYLKLSVIFILIISTSCKEHNESAKSDQISEGTESKIKSPSKENVEQAVIKFNNALVNPTLELMGSLCSSQLTYGHSSGLIQNKEEFIDDIVNGPFNFISVETLEQTITISANTAIVRHIFSAKAANDGNPVDVRIGNVQIYQSQEDGSLKLLARQAYKLPN
ncbi:nuclear transport factor 2 family protein [Flavobacteriaceae bacterium LMO-SS05]